MKLLPQSKGISKQKTIRRYVVNNVVNINEKQKRAEDGSPIRTYTINCYTINCLSFYDTISFNKTANVPYTCTESDNMYTDNIYLN